MNPTDLILEKFEQISSIPRDTKNEAGIRAWLRDWASARGLESQTDRVGNLVIQVPASGGYENHPTLILQGHLDMVCQKTPDSKHDFTRDPIRILRDGDWLKADKTTLGADNGIAIALMMSIVEDSSVAHPPLELLLTVEEERLIRRPSAAGTFADCRRGTGHCRCRQSRPIFADRENTHQPGFGRRGRFHRWLCGWRQHLPHPACQLGISISA